MCTGPGQRGSSSWNGRIDVLQWRKNVPIYSVRVEDDEDDVSISVSNGPSTAATESRGRRDAAIGC